MTWNYRICKQREDGTPAARGDVYYAVHEVFYDDTGKPTSMTTDAVTFAGDDPKDVVDALEKALSAFRQHGVFVPPESW